jgi:hypothetical protein
MLSLGGIRVKRQPRPLRRLGVLEDDAFEIQLSGMFEHLLPVTRYTVLHRRASWKRAAFPIFLNFNVEHRTDGWYWYYGLEDEWRRSLGAPHGVAGRERRLVR